MSFIFELLHRMYSKLFLKVILLRYTYQLTEDTHQISPTYLLGDPEKKIVYLHSFLKQILCFMKEGTLRYLVSILSTVERISNLRTASRYYVKLVLLNYTTM